MRVTAKEKIAPTTTFAGPDVDMGTVPGVVSSVVELLVCTSTRRKAISGFRYRPTALLKRGFLARPTSTLLIPTTLRMFQIHPLRMLWRKTLLIPTTKTCISERSTLLAVIGVALWIWVMAHAGLSAIMQQLRALRVALPIGVYGTHWDQFPEG
jgi:hypothetical protein